MNHMSFFISMPLKLLQKKFNKKEWLPPKSRISENHRSLHNKKLRYSSLWEQERPTHSGVKMFFFTKLNNCFIFTVRNLNFFENLFPLVGFVRFGFFCRQLRTHQVNFHPNRDKNNRALTKNRFLSIYLNNRPTVALRKPSDLKSKNAIV